MKEKYMNTKIFFYAIALLLAIVNESRAQNISYSFANATITNDGTDTFYEADIMISTDTDFQLGLGQFYIDYNSAAFGTNINGGSLSFAHPAAAAIGEATYILDQDYLDAISLYNVNLANNTNTKLSVAWTQAQNIAFYPTITASGSPHKFCHLKIRFVDTNQDPTISLDNVLSQDLTYNASSTPFAGDGAQITNDTYDSSNTTPIITWTGNTDNDWHTTSNWSSNTIPTSSNTVLVPNTVTNYPTASSNAFVNTITINSGASFIAQSGFSGSVTYNRTLTSSNWYLISSPVIGQDEDDFVSEIGLETGTGNNLGLGSYNTDTDMWSYYQNGSASSNTLTSGLGYSVNLSGASGEVSFTGTLRTTDLSFNLDTSGNGFNLLGNPFTSYINSNTLFTINDAILDSQTLWIWDQSANAGNGAYITKVAADNFQIAPGQGYFVQSNGNIGLYYVNESFLSHQGTDTFSRNTNPKSEIHLNISDDTNKMQAKIYYIEGATEGFDNGFDGPIFSGNRTDHLNIYTTAVNGNSEKKLAIQSLPNQNYENMVIPIGVQTKKQGNIAIAANLINFPSGLNVFIEDTVNNTFVQLNQEKDSYKVTLPSNYNSSNRFFLHTSYNTLSTLENATTKPISMFVNLQKELVIKNLGTNENIQVSIYNTIGQEITNTSFNNKITNTLTFNLSKFTNGIYMVKLVSNNVKTSKKIIIK
ncbi:T9SS type A sorting domain-containing protein [Tenacibaculum sp. 190524A02b]|uniref:T9SS type A sorting domain-containing protein n=1 Tax=Tenacibaculum vairaonense TaxID=3137860 RepID=UPI0031FA5D00